MEDKALDMIRTMLERRKLGTTTERHVVENYKKMDKVTCYKIGDILVCFSQKDKVLAGDIHNIIDYGSQAGFGDKANVGIIIVAMSPPSENVLRVAKSFAKNRLLFFHISQLQFDITTHRMSMPHRILSEEEKKAVFEKFKISDPANQLPWIDSQDTMIKWIGAIPGDIIEVTRHSDSAGNSFYYRYCVEDVNAAE